MILVQFFYTHCRNLRGTLLWHNSTEQRPVRNCQIAAMTQYVTFQPPHYLLFELHSPRMKYDVQGE